MPDEHVKKISVVIDTLIGLYALEPILIELSKQGFRTYIFCPESIEHYIAENIPEIAANLQRLETLARKYRPALYIHRFLRQLLTSPEFSFQYRLLSDPKQYRGDKRYWITAQLSKVFPKLPHNRVNVWLARLVGPIVRNPFPTKQVLTVSRTSLPHLFCSRDIAVFTVLESWDHPVKWPVGHCSKAVFVWNEDLADDWRTYQGDSNVHSTYPLKMRYWLERPTPVRESTAEKTAVYCAGTSSLSYINDLFRYELKVIDAICKATKEAGWRLLIKPKPNGIVGDFDRFLERYDHIQIGEYRGVNSSVDYYLDDAYNERRAREMAGSKLLINSLTTFALDAALMGMPCLQLDLRLCTEYKGVSEGQTNHHIARYLLNDQSNCLVVGSGELKDCLSNYLQNPDLRAERTRDRLKTWLSPQFTLSNAVGLVVKEIVSDQDNSR